MTESIEQLRRAERDAIENAKLASRRAREAREKLDAAQAKVDGFGPEPGIRCVVRFARTFGGVAFDFAALRVAKGWYTTGDIGLPRAAWMAATGPWSWEELCSVMMPGTLRVANGWSNSTTDAEPSFREPVPGEYLMPSGQWFRSFFLPHSEREELLRKAATHQQSADVKTTMDAGSIIASIDPAGGPGEVIIGIVGSGKSSPITIERRVVNEAGDFYDETVLVADDSTNVTKPKSLPQPDFTVHSRLRMRPDDKCVTVHEVRDNRVPHSDADNVVASFEGPDAAWRAAQSAASRNAR